MGQAKEETAPMFGIVGWFRNIVKKDKPVGGSSVTPSSPRRSTSRKRVAAVEPLQVTTEAPRPPENTALPKCPSNNGAQQRPQTLLEAGKKSLRDSEVDSRPKQPCSVDISTRAEVPPAAVPTTYTSSQAAAVCDSDHPQSAVLALQTAQQQWQLQRPPSKRATYLLELAKSVDFDEDDGDDEATKAKPTGGRTPVQVLDPKGMEQSFLASSWLKKKRLKESATPASNAPLAPEQQQVVKGPVLAGLQGTLVSIAQPPVGINNDSGGPLLLPRRVAASTAVTTGYAPAATAAAWQQGGGGNPLVECNGKDSGGGKGSGSGGGGATPTRVSLDENRGAPLKEGKGPPVRSDKQPGGGLMLSVPMPGQTAAIAPLQQHCSDGILPFRISASEVEDLKAASAEPGLALKKTISAVSTSAFRGPSDSSVPSTAADMPLEPLSSVVDGDRKILRLSSSKEALTAGDKGAVKPLRSCLVVHEERSSNATTRWETETGMEASAPGPQKDQAAGDSSKRDDVARWLVTLPEPWGPSSAGAASRGARPRSRQPLGPDAQPVDALPTVRSTPPAKSLAQVREAHGQRWYSLVQPAGPGQHSQHRLPVPQRTLGNGGSSFVLPTTGEATVNGTTAAVPARPEKARSFGADGAQKMDVAQGGTVVALGGSKGDASAMMDKMGFGTSKLSVVHDAGSKPNGMFGSFVSGAGNQDGRLPGCWNDGGDRSGQQPPPAPPAPPPPPPTPWQKAPQRQGQQQQQNGHVNGDVDRTVPCGVASPTQQKESARQQGALCVLEQQEGSEPQPHQRKDRKARSSRGIVPLDIPSGTKTAYNAGQYAVSPNSGHGSHFTQRPAQNGSRQAHKHHHQQHQHQHTTTSTTTARNEGTSTIRGEDTSKGRRKQQPLHVRIATDPLAADGGDGGILGRRPSSGRRTSNGDGVRFTEDGDDGIFGWDDQAPSYLPAHRISVSSQSSTIPSTRSATDTSGKIPFQVVRVSSPRSSSTIRPSHTGGQSCSNDNNAMPADNGDLGDVYSSNSRALAAQAPLMRTARPRQSKPSVSVRVEGLGTAALNPLTWQQQSVLSPTGGVAVHMMSKRSTRDGDSSGNNATGSGVSRRTSGALQPTGSAAANAAVSNNNNINNNRVVVNGGGAGGGGGGGATGGTLLSKSHPTTPITPAGRFFRASPGYGGATALFSIVSFRSRVGNGDDDGGSGGPSGELEVD